MWWTHYRKMMFIESKGLVCGCSNVLFSFSVCLKFFTVKCWKDVLTREKFLFKRQYIDPVHKHKIFNLFDYAIYKKTHWLIWGLVFDIIHLFLLSHMPFSLWQSRTAEILVLGKNMFHNYPPNTGKTTLCHCSCSTC